MTRAVFLLRAVALAVACATAVIVIGGHFDGAALLPMQLALIVGPTLLPFLVLLPTSLTGPRAWLACAALPVIGWAGMIVADVQHAGQPDASFSALLGWSACALATMLMLAWAIVHAVRGAMTRRA